MWKNTYWDNETQRVFASDMFGNLLMCYSYADKQMHMIQLEGSADLGSIFLPIEGSSDQYLVSTANVGNLMQWDGQSDTAQKTGTVFEMDSASRVDGILVGPHGNMYVSDFGAENCLDPPRFGVYGYRAPDQLFEYADGFVTTAGSVLIQEHRVYYHLDGCAKKLHAFRWNPITDDLSKFGSEFGRNRNRWMYSYNHKTHC